MLFYIFHILLLLLSVNNTNAQLIISEIYRDPSGKESDLCAGASHEFIELLNMGPQPIPIENLFITNGIEADSVIAVSTFIEINKNCIYNARVIPVGKIAIILDPDYLDAVKELSCGFDLPDSVILLQCSDRAFGVSGLGGDHGVVVYRGTKNRIDTILCCTSQEYLSLHSPTETKLKLSDPPNVEGISLVAEAVLSDSTFFKYCTKNISPGRVENLQKGWMIESELKKYDTATVNCILRIRNITEKKETDVRWEIVSEKTSIEKKIFEGTVGLNNNYSEISLKLPTDLAPFSIVLFTEDRLSWNIDISTAFLPPDAIRITEIFYRSNDSEPEWFEILNNSPIPINLKNWSYGKSYEKVKLTEIDWILNIGEYAIITRSKEMFLSKYPTVAIIIIPQIWIPLNNYSDTICLFDGDGELREMVCYDSKWFSLSSYQSIERNSNKEGCNQESWSTTFRATPQKPNSALYWRNTSALSLEIGPIPFTPDNDGKDDLLAIRVKAPSPFPVSLHIYGFDGRILKEFSEIKEEITYWDGTSNKGKAPVGPFFVIATINSKSKEKIRKKGILWRR
ncbi:MAG: gliding motility-associated C-terminal domain-containing protein [Chitinispirillaceae bacterium]|nr:gliding motility-associated C-terminal domain-containing protein [Chitinispirillaceae bacterium]